MVRCPKCDVDIGHSYQEADPSVGIMSGGWFCEACDLPVGDHEVDRSSDDDVPIGPAHIPGGPIGTPSSQISGRPGQPGFEEFKRIARTWGYD